MSLCVPPDIEDGKPFAAYTVLIVFPPKISSSNLLGGPVSGQIRAVKISGRRDTDQEKFKDRINHPNVEFLGYDDSGAIPSRQPYPRIGACQYLKGKDVNFPGRWQTVLDIGAGLFYLHGLNIVHGDLKPSNILINSDGRAVISDIDRSIFIDERGFTTTDEACSYRYASPEILGLGDLEETFPIRVTRPMDIYSFMMTSLELFTGLPPFHPCKFPGAIVFAIGEGKRPLRHNYPVLHNDVWSLLESGWAHSPESRPEVGLVVSQLEVLRCAIVPP